MSGGTGFGITPQGFVLPQLIDLQSQLNQALQAQFGAAINLTPSGFFGQFSGIEAERFSLIWQALQDVYLSQTPDTAFGASLDNVGAIVGIPRLGPKPSVVQNVKLFGTPGTIIPGTTTQFSVQNSPTSLFFLNATVTLGVGQNCIQTIEYSAVPVSGSYVLGINGNSTSPIAHDATALQIQTSIRALNFCSGCVVTSLSPTKFQIAFSGPATGGLMIQPIFQVSSDTLLSGLAMPVSVLPVIVQPGVDQAAVTVTATQDGPVIANTGTLNQIATPISGLTNVLNVQDAVLGRFAETDNAYRARMAQERQIAGAGTVEAIRSRLLATAGVTSALVYENVDEIPDAQGRPPNCFESVVSGGLNLDIGNTIWAAKPAGIKTYGTISQPILDSQGQTHIMKFSRPTQIPIFIIANLTIDAILYPANGDVLVKEAFANYINNLGQGVSIIVIPLLISQLAPIPGIDDAVILIGTAPGPTLPNNITILAFQEAITDTADITVNHV